MTKFLAVMVGIAGLAGTASAKNPVVVDNAGTGDFTTVQAAIDSWCAGGANAGETAPFIINIRSGSGPYDEGITLDQAVAGHGNIAGDIVIQTTTPGDNVVLKLQPHSGSTEGADDGLMISQDIYNVTMRDLVFTRSLTNFPADDLVRQDEAAPNTTLNTLAFYNCVFTEVGVDGEPLTRNKAGALVAPAPVGGPARVGTTPFLLQHWGDAGESINVILDNCVFYAGTSSNCYVRSDGSGPETVTINNCLSTYAGYNCFQGGGTNPQGVLNVTGTDVTQGPLNCTAALYPLTGGHCLMAGNTVAGQVSNVSNFLAEASGAPSTTLSRGVTGGNGQINLSNVIIDVQGYGVVDITHDPTTWNNVTINTPTAAYLSASGAGTPAAGSLTVTDSIISGGGTKFAALNNLPTGGITVKYSALPTSGPNAIGATGTIVEENNIYDDPMYVSTDGLLATFMDVNNPTYASAGTGGTPLRGGANYVGPSAAVNNWTLY